MADLMTNGNNGLTPVYNVGNDGDDFFGHGSGWIVFFLFFLMAWGGFGNGGYGPWGNGNNQALANYATQADINNGFQYQNLNAKLGDIGNDINTLGYNQLQGLNTINTTIMGGMANINNSMLQNTNATNMAIMQNANNLAMGIAEQTNALNMNMVQTGNAITNGMANLGYVTQNQICGVNNNIEAVKYQLATEACATRAESDANTQKILDRLTTMQMNDKDNQIYALQSDLQAARNQIDNAAQTQALVSALKPYPVPAYTVGSPYASANGCGCTLS
jgi:hypothetical protein